MNIEDVKSTTIIEIPANEIREVISIDVICRLCANQSDKLIGIYSEEGLTNDLANKMNLYLPIKVSETDSLPLQCCWNCASTLLAWHDLVITTVEADRRLRSYQFVIGKQLITTPESYDTSVVSSIEQTNQVLPESVGTSLNAFCQTESLPGLDHDDSNDPSKADEKSVILKKVNFVNFAPMQTTLTVTDSLQSYITTVDQRFLTDNDVTNNDHHEVMTEFQTDQLLNTEQEQLLQDENNDMADILQDTHQLDEDSCDVDQPDAVKEEPNYTYACQFCPQMFETKVETRNHFREAHLEQLGDPALKTPIKKVRRKNAMIDQQLVNAAKVVVDGRVYYNCKECGKSLHSPYTYVWHMRIHTGERPFVCDLCGKQFRVSQGLVRHLKETHERIKKFGCDLCGRMFATRRNVEEHRRIHTNERPYICVLCGKAFKQKASLFVHNRSHSDTFPFRCSYCNQGFRTKPPLLIHVTKHTGEKPYPCDVCGRCFRIKYELKRHRLIHSDEKPFSCSECGLSFRQKRYLRNHTKVNHNVS